VCLAVLLLFVAYVTGEIASIVILSGFIGGLKTIAVLGAAGVLGVFLLAGRAAATLTEAAEALAKREPVGEVVASSALAAFAGVLFIAPGVLSDVVALILLLPPTRARLAARMAAGMKARAQVIVAHARGPGGAPPPGVDEGFIDVEGVETKPSDKD
jgi:UPF0716 protein FxsA